MTMMEWTEDKLRQANLRDLVVQTLRAVPGGTREELCHAASAWVEWSGVLEGRGDVMRSAACRHLSSVMMAMSASAEGRSPLFSPQLQVTPAIVQSLWDLATSLGDELTRAGSPDSPGSPGSEPHVELVTAESLTTAQLLELEELAACNADDTAMDVIDLCVTFARKVDPRVLQSARQLCAVAINARRARVAAADAKGDLWPELGVV